MMPAMSEQRSNQITARLRADPEIQAIMTRNEFEAVASALMTLNLNIRSQDHRHRLARQWCETMAVNRWRRRIVERERYARLDRVYLDFECRRDATAFEKWLAERGW